MTENDKNLFAKQLHLVVKGKRSDKWKENSFSKNSE